MGKAHLSSSQLETFLQCERKWVARYIEANKGDPSEALGLGGAFHNVLQEFGEWRMSRHSGAIDARSIKLQFNAELRRLLAEQDPKGTLLKSVSAMEARGHAMLDAFVAQIAPTYRPIEVEKPFDFDIPDLDPLEGEHWTVTGRIDARTAPGGELTIVDWKTANKPWPRGAEDDKIQATIYLLSDMMRWRPLSTRVTFIVFPTKWNEKEQRFECKADVRPTTRPVEALNGMQTILKQSAMRVTELYKDPVAALNAPRHASYLCNFCPRVNTCFVGQSFLHERNRWGDITVDEDDNLLNTAQSDEQGEEANESEQSA